MKPIQRAYLQLHIAVFLFGFTAILGKLITLSELSLVWWRMMLTTLSFLFFPRLIKAFLTVPKKLRWQLFFVGIVVALHWIFFFGAVKYSNVSICLVGMATGSFFTAIFEPLFFKQKIKPYEVILGAMVIPGMYLVVQSVQWNMLIGIVMALISALLAVVFSILNKKYVVEADTKVITFIELGSGWLFLCLILPFYISITGAEWIPTWQDLGYLLVLALLCTTLAFVLSLNALRHISAFTNNLVINLEPVYGIIIAWLLFQENKEVGEHFYYGVLIVLLAVFSYPIVKRRFEKGE
jgi:drug/metabolite transporter (DMT)-like permease